MELLEYNDNNIIFANDIETYAFTNLNSCDYYNLKNKNNWILNHYIKQDDNIKLDVNVSFNKNGTYNYIILDYYDTSLVRRVLELNDKEKILSDCINLCNYDKNTKDTKYYTDIPSNTTIGRYLNKKNKVFKNYRGIFKNDFISDDVVIEFLNKNNYFGKLFNNMGNNYEEVLEIINIADSNYLDKYNEFKGKKLTKKR